MRKFLLLFCILLSAIILLPQHVDAQSKKKRRKSNRNIGTFAGNKRAFNPEINYLTIGGGINALNYFGDIAPRPNTFSTDISFTRPGINIFAQQRFGDRYSLRANFMWGRLRANDVETVGEKNFNQENANRYLRNLGFRNDIYELSFTGQIELFSHGGRYTSRPQFNAYAFGGIGVLYHNPKGQVPDYFTRDAFLADDPTNFTGGGNPRYYPLENAGEWVSLKKLGTEGQNFSDEQRARYEQVNNITLAKPYSNFQIVIPLGIGARYKVTNNIDLAIEFSYRYTFTDYLDDVSGYYVDLGSYGDPANQNDALAMALSDMSNQFNQQEFANIQEFTYSSATNTYTSVDNPSLVYTRAAGYGWPSGEGGEITRNMRGDGGNENDIFIVTNITISYILGGRGVSGAKFR